MQFEHTPLQCYFHTSYTSYSVASIKRRHGAYGYYAHPLCVFKFIGCRSKEYSCSLSNIYDIYE
jgi:hypothetical protein